MTNDSWRDGTPRRYSRSLVPAGPVECGCNLCCYARKHPQLGKAPHDREVKP